MSPSLRLFIAQEEQSLLRYADALRDARQCAADFETDARLAHRNEFLATCHGIADAMAQRVARITVRLPAGVSNATVTVRGEALPETDGREGLKSLELLIAMYLSARDGKRISLPLAY